MPNGSHPHADGSDVSVSVVADGDARIVGVGEELDVQVEVIGHEDVVAVCSQELGQGQGDVVETAGNAECC